MHQRNAVFVTICPEDVEILVAKFPRATIIHGDVRDPELRAEVLKRCKGVDIAMVALLCGPSSDAATEHDKNDERNATGLAATSLARACEPGLMCVENVSSFKRRQRPTYDALEKEMKLDFDQVVVMYLNAMDTMVPQQRNRAWFVGCSNNIDLMPWILACRQQRALRFDGVTTSPTLRAAFAPYRSDMHKWDGLFVPWIKGCPHDRGRPRRIITTDGPSGTVTTKYVTKQEWFRRHKHNGADEAPKHRTLCLSAQEWGVVQGFSIFARWSTARSCKCPGCVDLRGRCRASPGAT